MNIILMGPPGSGKSTQAKLLAEKLGLPFVKTGNIYREVAKEDSPLGRKVKTTIEQGDLVDDETTLEVVDKKLAQIQGGFVVDGFPRTLVQAQRELFPVDKVIQINISDEEATKRILNRAKIEGRADDKPEVIEERLMHYHSQTEPIISYYKQQRKLTTINGSGPVAQIAQLIFNSTVI